MIFKKLETNRNVHMSVLLDFFCCPLLQMLSILSYLPFMGFVTFLFYFHRRISRASLLTIMVRLLS